MMFFILFHVEQFLFSEESMPPILQFFQGSLLLSVTTMNIFFICFIVKISNNIDIHNAKLGFPPMNIQFYLSKKHI